MLLITISIIGTQMVILRETAKGLTIQLLVNCLVNRVFDFEFDIFADVLFAKAVENEFDLLGQVERSPVTARADAY